MDRVSVLPRYSVGSQVPGGSYFPSCSPGWTLASCDEATVLGLGGDSATLWAVVGCCTGSRDQLLQKNTGQS